MFFWCINLKEALQGDTINVAYQAHLHFVTDEDIRRMAETGSVPEQM